jgi:hypothetical protein
MIILLNGIPRFKLQFSTMFDILRANCVVITGIFLLRAGAVTEIRAIMLIAVETGTNDKNFLSVDSFLVLFTNEWNEKTVRLVWHVKQ